MPNYSISPIHSDESDVDLSDSDPTFRRPVLINRPNIRISSSSSESSPTRNPNIENQERRSRKRTRNPESWKDNKAKKLRNCGKSYQSRSKKTVPARCMKPVCSCRLKCFDNITENSRLSIFENFWRLGNIDLQRSFIRACMVEVKPKYKYTNSAKPRQPNNYFFFTIDGSKIRVCKTYFLNTLSISDRQIRTVKAKTNDLGFVGPDERGKHDKKKTVDPLLKQQIKDHINSIPRIESHYLRAVTGDKEYISDGKTIADLCIDFNNGQKQKNLPEAEYWLYLHIFNYDFNIGFYQPKKDRCELCVAYQLALPETKEQLQLKYENHLTEKNLCRQEKLNDRKQVTERNICAVYDLQSVMLCPSPKYFYYTSKLNCLDFTITELNKKDLVNCSSYNNVFCYFWDETQGQRGANEISSCVFDYIKNVCQRYPGEKLDITFYSDNCVGQNKNKIMTSMYSYAVSQFPNLNSITHKYFIKGHTQNEADNVHSLIEKQIKQHERSGPIYIPQQFVPLIISSRKTGNPFKVKEISYDFFLNLKLLQEQWGYNYNENTDKNNVVWNDIKVLKFTRDDPFIFNYKTSYTQSDYCAINMRNKRKKMMDITEIEIKPVYSESLKLKTKKANDLKDLAKKNLVPSYYAGYYNSL